MQKRKPGRKSVPEEKKLRGMEVQMYPADIDLLTEEAERRGVSRSELVRGMIAEELEAIRGSGIPTVTMNDLNISGHIATPELAKHVGKLVRLKTPCGDIVALVKEACDSSDWNDICVDVELEFRHGITLYVGSTIPKREKFGGECTNQVNYASAPDYFPKDKHAFTWWDFLALSLENK